MKQSNQKGNVLLFAIVAMTAISVLGAGIYFMTTTSTFSGLEANAQNRAYQLAVAGRDYALAKNLEAADSGDFKMANDDKFRLAISGDTITSTGIINEGKPYEARRIVTAKVTDFGSRADISFAKDIGSFSPTATAQAGFVSVDQAAGQISLGQLQTSLFGSVWYGGDTAAGNCQNGKCDFGKGFRAYFLFKLTRGGSDIPHGFTFAVFNGTDNSKTSAGGDSRMPELLAYGGNSCTQPITGDGNCTSWLAIESERGIKSPKIGIEFDGRRNTNYPDFCPPSRLDSESREDGNRTHMAYVFWGDNTTACGNRGNSTTYDDNRHGAGTADDPVNAIATDAADTVDYFIGSSPPWNADWLYNTAKVYAVRIEVTRASEKNANNKYDYKINTWLKHCSSENISDPTACSEFPGLSNTKVEYKSVHYPAADPAAFVPTLNRTVELTPAFHTKFDKFLFGWTAAAGSASRENVALSNFQLYFEK